MKKTNALQRRFRVFAGVMTLVLALAIGMFADSFATVSRADSQGKITASSAKIRKSAGTSGEALGSVTKDTVITIKGEVQGTDGYVWYQIEHNGTSGYIRSDLVKLSSDTSTETPATGINTAGVTKVNRSGERLRSYQKSGFHQRLHRDHRGRRLCSDRERNH